MRKLVLFDIDGTLVLTGRAGLRAMNGALLEAFGVPDALRDVPVAGRTDWSILVDAVQRLGHALDDRLLRELERGYLDRLAAEIELPGEGRKGVMPGIKEILDQLATRTDVLSGLLTGNFEEGARIKLAHFDLWRYFSFGAYGGDSADRNALVPIAVQRARAAGLPEIGLRDVLVVGDTPADIACAHAGGAVAVGVATGSSPVEELKAAGADHVFADLTETDAFLELLR